MTLNDILASTERESKLRQEQFPLREIARKIEKMGPTRGFRRALAAKPFGLIAEIKRKSPSMGEINPLADAIAVPVYHANDFVSAISVLTQESHFGGSPKILKDIAQKTQCRPKPILRKDFIFSEYEVYFSRFIGADAILLMANVVTDAKEFKKLHDLANDLGMDVLCEVHEEQEIDILPDSARVCGINSRRFKNVRQKQNWTAKMLAAIMLSSSNQADTKTDISAFELVAKLPASCLKVAESGISKSNFAEVVKNYPFNAALVGTSLLSNNLAKRSRSALAHDAIEKEINALRDIYYQVRGDLSPPVVKRFTKTRVGLARRAPLVGRQTAGV
jgi:indole-3-glycerol phosphate synthase